MPISLSQLGKIYALTESPSKEEAATAEETFRKWFFRWCDEQGLPSDHGLVTFEADPFQALLLDTVVPYLGVRHEAMGPFHSAIIGPLDVCRWLEVLRNYVLPKVEPGTRHLNASQRQAYEVGVCVGVGSVLEEEYGRPVATPTPVPDEPAAPTVVAAPETGSATPPPQPPEAAPRLPLNQNILLQGRRLGVSLARKVTASRRPPPRTA